MGEANKTTRKKKLLKIKTVDCCRTKSGSHFTGKILQLELLFQLTIGGHLVSVFPGSLEGFAELPRPADHGSVNDKRCEVALSAMNPSVVKQDRLTVPIICSVLHSHG